MTTKNEIRFLSNVGGKYAAFSNFAHSPFTLDGHEWQTVEHYFQAAKFVDHPAYYAKIRDADSPAEAKRLGQYRKLPIVPDWDRTRCAVMERALMAKFSQNDDLRQLLLGTGDARLIEANKHDEYWGIGSGRGANRLGRLMMKVRAALRGGNNSQDAKK